MAAESPNRHVIVVAGPNGAGKSTTAPALLKDALAVKEFVNADAIASGLSPFRPETVSIAAGRIMLDRMRSLASAGDNFAFETTLASRSFAPWLKNLRSSGYRVHVLFLWLRTPELAIQRVTERARLGGHVVPEANPPALFGRTEEFLWDIHAADGTMAVARQFRTVRSDADCGWAGQKGSRCRRPGNLAHVEANI
ncbi:MAG TPA: zeta toxin family protein [Micropepsaceae bacterium]|nr:zeta toxin family protein [Micropepsaceae bacterium]